MIQLQEERSKFQFGKNKNCDAVVSPKMVSIFLVIISVWLRIDSSHGFSTIPRRTSTNIEISKTKEPFLSQEDCVRDQLGYLPSNYVGVSAWKAKSKNSHHRRGIRVVLPSNNNNSTAAIAGDIGNGDATDNPLQIPVAIQTYPLNGGAKRRQNKAKQEPLKKKKQQPKNMAQQFQATNNNKNHNHDHDHDHDHQHTPPKSVIQSPFPTLFWLTCPDISKAIANLESKGFVQTLEDKINGQPDLVERLYQSHTEYATLRWNSLTKEDRTTLEQSVHANDAYDVNTNKNNRALRRMYSMMKDSGISGTNVTNVELLEIHNDDDPRVENIVPVVVPSLKCLHAHYAHYRSTVDLETTKYINPVGELVHQQLQVDFPDLDL